MDEALEKDYNIIQGLEFKYYSIKNANNVLNFMRITEPSSKAASSGACGTGRP